MRGLDGKGDYSEGKKENHKVKKKKKTIKKQQRDTRTPNEVRQQMSVTCVE